MLPMWTVLHDVTLNFFRLLTAVRNGVTIDALVGICFFEIHGAYDFVRTHRTPDSDFKVIQRKWMSYMVTLGTPVPVAGGNLFLWNTRKKWFCAYSLHITLRLLGHSKEMNVVFGDFRNTSVCCGSCLRSTVMQTAAFRWALQMSTRLAEHFPHRPSTCCSLVSSSSAFTTRSSQLLGLGKTRRYLPLLRDTRMIHSVSSVTVYFIN